MSDLVGDSGERFSHDVDQFFMVILAVIGPLGTTHQYFVFLSTSSQHGSDIAGTLRGCNFDTIVVHPANEVLFVTTTIHRIPRFIELIFLSTNIFVRCPGTCHKNKINTLSLLKRQV